MDEAPRRVRNLNVVYERAEFPDFVRTTVLSVRYPGNNGAVQVRDDCELLVKRMIASASADERSAITERARSMIQRANELARE